MAQVTYLRSHMAQSAVALDNNAVETLEISLGSARCGQVLADVCLDMMDKVGLFEQELIDGSPEQAAKIARTISSLAAQVGLEEFSAAAANVSRALYCDDFVALTAVLERFRRITDTSLFAVMERSSLGGY